MKRLLVLLPLLLLTGWSPPRQTPAPPPCGVFFNPALTLTLDPATTDFPTLTPDLLAYLNAGGNPRTITLTDGRATVWDANVMGDNVPDWVLDLAFYGGTSVDSYVAGAIYAVTCTDDRLTYTGDIVLDYYGWRGGDWMGAEAGLLALEDVDGDGAAELIHNAITNIAAHGWATREYGAWHWDASDGWRNLMPTTDSRYGVATLNAALDPAPETMTLWLEEPQFRHHNYEEWSRLQRGYRYEWGMGADGLLEVVCQQAATPAEYRIQALEDATNAIHCGDLTGAMSLYMAAYDDPDLLPWTRVDNLCTGCDPLDNAADLAVREDTLAAEGYTLPDVERDDDLRAYAMYRLMMVYNLMGFPDAAEAAYQELEAAYPTHRYTQLAAAYREGGCPRALGYALEQGLTSPFVDYVYVPWSQTPRDEPLCIGPDAP